MKQLAGIFASLALGVTLLFVALTAGRPAQVQAQARSANSVLSQLGAAGVVEEIPYGSNTLYAHYLVRLNSNGFLDLTLFEPSINTPVVWNKVLYIDGVNGGDGTNGNGTVTRPYLTFTNAIAHASNDTAFVFAPGVYPAPTVTNTNITVMALIGMNPTNTLITGMMKLDNDLDMKIDLYRIGVSEIKQMQYKDMEIGLYDHARVETRLSRQYPTSLNSILTVHRDPETYLAEPVIGVTNVVYTLTHNATNMEYTAGVAAQWLAPAPANIGDALDTLSIRMPLGTNDGDILYWDTDEWKLLPPTGNPNYVLHGGPVPFWDEPILNIASNVVGQVIFGTADIHATTTTVFYPVTFSQAPVPVLTIATNAGQMASPQVVAYDTAGFSFVVWTNGGMVADPWPVTWHSAYAFSWLTDFGGYMFYTVNNNTSIVWGVNNDLSQTNKCGEYLSTPGITDMPAICTNTGFNIYWKGATSTVYVVNSGGQTNLVGTYYKLGVPGNPAYEACSDSNGFHQVWTGLTNQVFMISPNSAYQNFFGEFTP